MSPLTFSEHSVEKLCQSASYRHIIAFNNLQKKTIQIASRHIADNGLSPALSCKVITTKLTAHIHSTLTQTHLCVTRQEIVNQ